MPSQGQLWSRHWIRTLSHTMCPRRLAGSSRGDAENGSLSDTPPPEEAGLEYQSSEGSFAEGMQVFGAVYRKVYALTRHDSAVTVTGVWQWTTHQSG